MTARDRLLKAGVTHTTMALLDDIATNDPNATEGETVYDYCLMAVEEMQELARRLGA
jgi:hypothetical protein